MVGCRAFFISMTSTKERKDLSLEHLVSLCLTFVRLYDENYYILIIFQPINGKGWWVAARFSSAWRPQKNLVYGQSIKLLLSFCFTFVPYVRKSNIVKTDPIFFQNIHKDIGHNLCTFHHSTHCKFLNARLECNYIVIFNHSHWWVSSTPFGSPFSLPVQF